MINYQEIELFEKNPEYWKNSPHNVRMLLNQYKRELLSSIEETQRYKDDLTCNALLKGWESWLRRVDALLDKDPYKRGLRNE